MSRNTGTHFKKQKRLKLQLSKNNKIATMEKNMGKVLVLKEGSISVSGGSDLTQDNCELLKNLPGLCWEVRSKTHEVIPTDSKGQHSKTQINLTEGDEDENKAYITETELLQSLEKDNLSIKEATVKWAKDIIDQLEDLKKYIKQFGLEREAALAEIMQESCNPNKKPVSRISSTTTETQGITTTEETPCSTTQLNPKSKSQNTSRIETTVGNSSVDDASVSVPGGSDLPPGCLELLKSLQDLCVTPTWKKSEDNRCQK